MSNIYKSGYYLELTGQTWHAEDAPWKAEQIERIIRRNGIQPRNIAEIGCGAGQILGELSKQPYLKDCHFEGYDISPQAIKLCERIDSKNCKYFCQDILTDAKDNVQKFDILLIIDVFEHVPDYMGFIEKCRYKADYKIYHIPIDICVSSVLRNTLIRGRYSVGHIHNFTADSAIATLKDTGHEIVDYFYTSSCFGLFKQHPSIKTAIANVPRWLFSKFSLPFTARVFGGYSLLVLTK
jgi:SAM-dependent methyltransferase